MDSQISTVLRLPYRSTAIANATARTTLGVHRGFDCCNQPFTQLTLPEPVYTERFPQPPNSLRPWSNLELTTSSCAHTTRTSVPLAPHYAETCSSHQRSFLGSERSNRCPPLCFRPAFHSALVCTSRNLGDFALLARSRSERNRYLTIFTNTTCCVT